MTVPPFEPEPFESMLARLPAALEIALDFKNGAPPLEMAPGLHRKHIFDFADGVRAIISRERNLTPFDHAIHLSFSVNPAFVDRWQADDFFHHSEGLIHKFGFAGSPIQIFCLRRAIHFMMPVP